MKNICNNCDLGLKPSDCSKTEMNDCIKEYGIEYGFSADAQNIKLKAFSLEKREPVLNTELLGINANPSKTHEHMLICKELNNIYEAKNADYGDSFGKGYKEYGLTMPCIRLEDKLMRLKQLSKSEAKVKDESIIDTLLDLANYSIMTVIELKGDK